MKLITLVIMTLVSSLAFAKVENKTVICDAVATTRAMFKNLKITLNLPDEEVQAPGKMETQLVEVTSSYDKEKRKVKMSLVDLGQSELLSGAFDIGSDFGSVGLFLFDDYDKNQLVVILNIPTDGPITKEIYICKK